MAQGFSTPTVIINNENVSINPNSLEFDEGFGEYTKRVESAGGGSVSTVSTRDISTAKSAFKFSLVNTAANIEKAREWKNNFDNNVVQITGDDNLTRSFTSAQVSNQYTVMATADGEIALEWESDPAS